VGLEAADNTALGGQLITAVVMVVGVVAAAAAAVVVVVVAVTVLAVLLKSLGTQRWLWRSVWSWCDWPLYRWVRL
jgi:hypothetical protein